ncbi:hypothetical protein CBW65_05555 [Tumebacillus avium]|uniref:ATPase AAA-type core domain-containing protein n=1 Tax=Tumebacillus avium TaxID=1903704 RepID=A0A1Y0IL91_9BACL|nr:ATP-binding protein [Tumebacillus avium]ARU60606.1 hypothetical protein CBW65_05555 [Tumebacillus avium]
MLLEFSVENFRSIKERLTLSMLAAEEETDLEQNLIHTDAYREGAILRSAVIYGANASGKTNVLRAFEFMVYFIATSHRLQKGDKLIEVSPFRMDESCANSPSKFEVIFIHEGMKYAYGLALDQEQVHEEYLYSFPHGKQQLIFERKNTTDYEFGSDHEEQSLLAKRTLGNASYLALATQFNYSKANQVFDWFAFQTHPWVTLYGLPTFHHTVDIMVDDENSRDMVMGILKSADLGIRDVGINKYEINPRLPQKYDIRFFREIIREGIVESFDFKYEEESKGTQRFFNLLGPVVTVLEVGALIIADELENSLHPLMMEQIVKLFNDPVHNPHGAQLIFTTHNTNLLDQRLFRRDQIWFTEKKPETFSTDLYSLCEFVPRQDEDYEAGYLNGRYGAIPFFGKEFLF